MQCRDWKIFQTIEFNWIGFAMVSANIVLYIFSLWELICKRIVLTYIRTHTYNAIMHVVAVADRHYNQIKWRLLLFLLFCAVKWLDFEIITFVFFQIFHDFPMPGCVQYVLLNKFKLCFCVSTSVRQITKNR